MTGREGGQRRAGVRERGEGFRERGEGVRERGEGDRDSRFGEQLREELDKPTELASAKAAAPEADVSGRPGLPEAPPRSIARRPALMELAGVLRTAREG